MGEYDYVILGGGLYGMYSAILLAEKNYKIVILEADRDVFLRATSINQARVHNGYHYPRSISTAIKSAKYFDKFSKDFSFAINDKFRSIYSIAKSYSYTTGEQFVKFCKNANIPCEEVYLPQFIDSDNVEASFETQEYSFDAQKLKEHFLRKIMKSRNIEILVSTYPTKVDLKNKKYSITTNSETTFVTSNVINTTYASTNQILKLFGLEKFKIKYEICEIIVCDVSEDIRKLGFTIMDGPFLSLVPFGLKRKHLLTSVAFTPHDTSYTELPIFKCQNNNKLCTSFHLENCNLCQARPKSTWNYMSQVTKKYLKNIDMKYVNSYFAIKPILKASEIDDSRPTVIRKLTNNPSFITVLSGKINTIYDLNNEIL